MSSDFLEKFYPGDEDLLIDAVRGDFGSISIYKKGPISDASFCGGVLKSFQSNIFLRENVCLWSQVFFDMGVSVALR